VFRANDARRHRLGLLLERAGRVDVRGLLVGGVEPSVHLDRWFPDRVEVESGGVDSEARILRLGQRAISRT